MFYSVTSGTLVLGSKSAKSAFFQVFGAELDRAEAPRPNILQAISYSDMKLDSNQKCVRFDPGGATGPIRRDPVNCVQMILFYQSYNIYLL